jgi:pilus assembly protein CpaC
MPRPRAAFGLAVVTVAMLLAVVADVAVANPKIRVTVGQSVTQTLDADVKTVSIADSDVADVVVAGPREVLINGKRIGLTTLVVWDQDNVSRVFDVVVRGPFSDRKIELRVQLAEVNRTKAMELGFDFLGEADNNSDRVLGGLYGGSVDTPTIPLSIFGGKPVQGASAIFQYVTDEGDVFQSMIHAAMSNGVLKVLAEPNVVAASGEEAEFLSGGEIPIPIAVSGTQGGTQITVEWKEFGVKVKFKPTIIDSNVVNLQIAPSVSSLDYGNAIEISGFLLPALRSRKAKTTVELADGEVLVIGGLLMEEEEKVHTRIPLLGHIPVGLPVQRYKDHQDRDRVDAGGVAAHRARAPAGIDRRTSRARNRGVEYFPHQEVMHHGWTSKQRS